MSIAAAPLPVSAFAEYVTYTGPVMILAWTHDDEGTGGMCVDDEGQIRMVPIGCLRIDLRYDWNSHHWVDVNGVTEPDAEEEPAPHGGETVP